MKKILFLILMMIFITSCGVSNRVITVGNVSVYSTEGEKIKTYNNVIFEQVPEQDTVYSISFIEPNGTIHFIKNSMIVIDGVEQILEPNISTTTSVIVYPYGYYTPYHRSFYYYHPRYRVIPPRRYEPRPTPNHNHPPRRR